MPGSVATTDGAGAGYDRDRRGRGGHAQAATPEGGGDLWFIETGDPESYYVVDGRRRLCFFRHRDGLVLVPCEDVERPSGAPSGRSDAATVPPEPPLHEGEGAAPEFDEAVAFARAYGEILCASRRGEPPKAREILQRHGFTPQRYTAVEARVRQEPGAWRTLQTQAAASCSQPATDLEAETQ